jgi:hypothetical protein
MYREMKTFIVTNKTLEIKGDGIVLKNGRVIICWEGNIETIVFYNRIEDVELLGHLINFD